MSWALPHIVMQLFPSRAGDKICVRLLERLRGSFLAKDVLSTPGCCARSTTVPSRLNTCQSSGLMPTLPFWLTCEGVNTIACPSVRLPVILWILIKRWTAKPVYANYLKTKVSFGTIQNCIRLTPTQIKVTSCVFKLIYALCILQIWK